MPISFNANSIFPYIRPNLQAQARLFCFPYAGANAAVFRGWGDQLPQAVEIMPVEIPGRGARLRESPYDSLSALVETLSRSLVPYMDKPFAFFGHSMGALISFELARQLRRQKEREPVQLFISGHVAPQVPRNHKCLHTLPEQELIAELRNLNGTPEEVLRNRELMQLLLPVVRSDFKVCETYQFTYEPPLDCPITAFGGLHDPDVTQENLEAWSEQTASTFNVHLIAGNHFYFQSNQAVFLKTLAYEVAQMLMRMGK